MKSRVLAGVSDFHHSGLVPPGRTPGPDGRAAPSLPEAGLEPASARVVLPTGRVESTEKGPGDDDARPVAGPLRPRLRRADRARAPAPDGPPGPGPARLRPLRRADRGGDPRPADGRPERGRDRDRGQR